MSQDGFLFGSGPRKRQLVWCGGRARSGSRRTALTCRSDRVRNQCSPADRASSISEDGRVVAVRRDRPESAPVTAQGKPSVMCHRPTTLTSLRLCGPSFTTGSVCRIGAVGWPPSLRHPGSSPKFYYGIFVLVIDTPAGAYIG